MSPLFGVIVGAIAGALAHLVGKGDGIGLMSIIWVTLGVFLGWGSFAFLGGMRG